MVPLTSARRPIPTTTEAGALHKQSASFSARNQDLTEKSSLLAPYSSCDSATPSSYGAAKAGRQHGSGASSPCYGETAKLPPPSISTATAEMRKGFYRGSEEETQQFGYDSRFFENSASNNTTTLHSSTAEAGGDTLFPPLVEYPTFSTGQQRCRLAETYSPMAATSMVQHAAHKPPESDELASSVPANIGDDGSIAPDDDALEFMVTIPETEGDEEETLPPPAPGMPPIAAAGKWRFSWRKLWAFTGPGFLMSIAYLDPGNIESDLQSGAIARYRLLWVLLSAHILGFLLQRLSARLGVVSGRHMAEMAFEYYPPVPRLLLWVMIEIAIIGSDMQEVIGTAIAFSLLSNGYIPLFAGVLITMVDTFTFLTIDRYGFRKLEVLFAALIATMAISFGYEFFIVKPDGIDLVAGMFIPWCSGCGRKEFLQAVSIVGAVIMPHNLYLHSALVKSRRIDRSKKRAVTEANLYYAIESGIALVVSFIINLFVVAVFAHGLYGRTNADVHASCEKRPEIPGRHIFPNTSDPVESDIYKGGIFLGCEFGLVALYVWGVGIMAAGQSSTMTGTYAGQFVMEGFLRIQWPRWRRVLVTRAIAIVPTLLVTLKARAVDNLTGMNDLLNCVQMIQLPFALLPIITFTAHRRIMYEYASGRSFQLFALAVSGAVVTINLYFSTDYILSELGTHVWYVWVGLAPLCLFYVALMLYLVVVCLQAMELADADLLYAKIPFLRRSDDTLTVRALWATTASVPPTRDSACTASMVTVVNSSGDHGSGVINNGMQDGEGKFSDGAASGTAGAGAGDSSSSPAAASINRRRGNAGNNGHTSATNNGFSNRAFHDSL